MNQMQNLINDCLIDTKHVERAAIINAKNATVIAASPKFDIQMPQAQIILDCFKHTNLTREKGFYFQDKTYTCNGHGFIIVKTAVHVLAATYNEHMFPSVCVEAVEKLADYLREKGK